MAVVSGRMQKSVADFAAGQEGRLESFDHVGFLMEAVLGPQYAQRIQVAGIAEELFRFLHEIFSGIGQLNSHRPAIPCFEKILQLDEGPDSQVEIDREITRQVWTFTMQDDDLCILRLEKDLLGFLARTSLEGFKALRPLVKANVTEVRHHLVSIHQKLDKELYSSVPLRVNVARRTPRNFVRTTVGDLRIREQDLSEDFRNLAHRRQSTILLLKSSRVESAAEAENGDEESTQTVHRHVHSRNEERLAPIGAGASRDLGPSRSTIHTAGGQQDATRSRMDQAVEVDLTQLQMIASRTAPQGATDADARRFQASQFENIQRLLAGRSMPAVTVEQPEARPIAQSVRVSTPIAPEVEVIEAPPAEPPSQTSQRQAILLLVREGLLSPAQADAMLDRIASNASSGNSPPSSPVRRHFDQGFEQQPRGDDGHDNDDDEDDNGRRPPPAGAAIRHQQQAQPRLGPSRASARGPETPREQQQGQAQPAPSRGSVRGSDTTREHQQDNFSPLVIQTTLANSGRQQVRQFQNQFLAPPPMNQRRGSDNGYSADAESATETEVPIAHEQVLPRGTRFEVDDTATDTTEDRRAFFGARGVQPPVFEPARVVQDGFSVPEPVAATVTPMVNEAAPTPVEETNEVLPAVVAITMAAQSGNRVLPVEDSDTEEEEEEQVVDTATAEIAPADTEAEVGTATDVEAAPGARLIRGFVRNVLGAFSGVDAPTRPESRVGGFEDPAPAPLVPPPMRSLISPANVHENLVAPPAGSSRPGSRLTEAASTMEEYSDALSQSSRAGAMSSVGAYNSGTEQQPINFGPHPAPRRQNRRGNFQAQGRGGFNANAINGHHLQQGYQPAAMGVARPYGLPPIGTPMFNPNTGFLSEGSPTPRVDPANNRLRGFGQHGPLNRHGTRSFQDLDAARHEQGTRRQSNASEGQQQQVGHTVRYHASMGERIIPRRGQPAVQADVAAFERERQRQRQRDFEDLRMGRLIREAREASELDILRQQARGVHNNGYFSDASSGFGHQNQNQDDDEFDRHPDGRFN